MTRKLILLSKDALGKFYLPTYGNSYWSTPNVDELASKGTVFTRFYTASPSSAMSYYSMFTGKYPYQSEQKNFSPINVKQTNTLFDKANSLGFETHVIWDEAWMTAAKLYSECYGAKTIMHPLVSIRQPVGSHHVHEGVLKSDKEIEERTVEQIEDCIREITKQDKDIFVWLHLPHVLNGRVGYGTDIDVYDRIVGIVRKFFSDNDIFLTADHGNMNGSHQKIGYGFDVYEQAICIPLITPRLENKTLYDQIATNTDIFDIIFNRVIPKHEYIYSDTAYYAQLHRKLAVVGQRYKYIYNKSNRTEELYDLIEDPNENQNLISDYMYDVDRKLNTPLRELYFYPLWDQIEDVRNMFRKEKNRLWKEENTLEHMIAIYQKYGKIIKRRYNKLNKIMKIKVMKRH